ncbi:unnamed protein product [Caenorhabditis angaria]|uniref:FHA domain-containing protein n=1 Tax=Caenorhabditis angaria TaxID=860376 RepID=A0A9P1MTC7_9PELO|nr:unnamed protein product [Caenorhabditis angaria]
MGRDRSPKYRKSPDRRRDRSRERRRESPRDRRRESPRRIKKEEYSSDEESRHRRNRNDRGDRRRSPDKRRDDGKKYGLEEQKEKWGKSGLLDNVKKEEEEIPQEEKKKVDLGVSGLLTEDTNTFRGVVIKYNEPPEAKKPNARWRLYPFKGEEALQVLYIHRQSAYLIGRDHKIADIPVDHPSCSKQHAVLQFRSMPFTRDDGSRARRIMPYIIDLGSGNGTYLNEEKIEPQRYIELKEKDMLKFGFSTREYVVMKEKEIVEESQDGPKQEPDSE